MADIPSGKRLQCANLKIAIEIADVPMFHMAMFNSYFDIRGYVGSNSFILWKITILVMAKSTTTQWVKCSIAILVIPRGYSLPEADT